jgi:hypothetical protein
MDDYPNSSEPWQPEAPDERVEAEQQEMDKLTSSVGVINDVLTWFETQAELYRTVDALGVQDNTPAEDVKYAVMLAKKMRAEFQSKSVAFRTEFAQYLRQKEVEDKLAE